MEEETIVITTVTEKVKFSEMSDRDKKIWWHGYNQGREDKYKSQSIAFTLMLLWVATIVIFYFRTI